MNLRLERISCGTAMKKENYNFIDLSGKRFSRFTVIKRIGTHKAKGGQGFPLWECKCDCGVVKNVTGAALRTGNTRSCGCINIVPDAPFTQMFGRYKRVSLNAGRSFELSFLEFKALTQMACHYCGEPPTNRKSGIHISKHHEVFIANGLDRKDSALGYTRNNSVPCCGLCNQAKNDLSQDEFMSLVAKIYQHSIQ